MKKISTLCALFLLFLLVLTGCNQTQNTDSTSLPDQGKVNLGSGEMPTIGDSVASGNLVYQILGVDKEKSIPTLLGGEAKPTKGAFLILDIRVENRGERNININQSMFRVRDKNGMEYEVSPLTNSYYNEKNSQSFDFFRNPLNPHTVRTGKIVFDVPDAPESDFIFIGKGGILLGDEVNIQLGP